LERFDCDLEIYISETLAVYYCRYYYLDIYLHVELVHFACEILIMGEGGVKNRRIFQTEMLNNFNTNYLCLKKCKSAISGPILINII
jgi:hypothetical protein